MANGISICFRFPAAIWSSAPSSHFLGCVCPGRHFLILFDAPIALKRFETSALECVLKSMLPH
jgi:hypothetical protein